MKKSTFKYLISTLLMIIFVSNTFLPCLTGNLREQNRYSINKDKMEKEGTEKDSSGESKDFLSVYLIVNPNDEHLVWIDFRYNDRGKSILPTRSLSVLNPPPDQA